MPLFEIATAAQLAGSVVLALFFVLLERHDPRPYLVDWMAAWIAQAVALAVFLASLRWGWAVSLAAYLFLEAGHGLLLCTAARHYRGGSLRRSRYGWMLLPLGAWAAAGPVLLTDPRALHAAQFAVLAATELAAAALLWPRGERSGMGVRLTAHVLALIGLLHALHVAAFAGLFGPDAPAMLLLQAGPFVTLMLQMLLALGMVLTVTESTQRALATSNAHLQEAEHRLKVLAETDPLTGCFNRRVFRDLVDGLRSGREGLQGAVLMLDMDDLKEINDRQGHAAGDEAIRRAAETIRGHTRSTDIVVRWGGDEFVVVIPGASGAYAQTRRNEVVESLVGAGLAASAGLAVYEEGKDIMTAVNEADREMYAAKAIRKGRASGTAG
jgi:diguanylate cyclase (GGDEF)-like protein